MGESVVRFARCIFTGFALVRSVNSTLIVLIPKRAQPKSLHNFRPINLCNVSYKLIMKIIVNRIQCLSLDLISPNQVSFVSGHRIHDNIVIAQELIHTMNRIWGKKKFMAIKIDLVKAYDHLR